MVGTTVSHYRILEHLGGGGMGVVYKAQDLRLDRNVALKFLPLELTRDPDAKERFIHEAKAASALQHDNICVIHDIDETSDGRTFIVLEYYDGETIKKRISRGPLPIDQAIECAIQVGEGLSEAHRHGIVHRDIKPPNVMVTSQGRMKIVDFGVALLTGATRLTTDGKKVGTVTYMSPEQARGDVIDHRTDVWSLGVLLYEMISGRLPFESTYEQALVYSILNVDPPLLSSLRPETPKRLDEIVGKALQKDAKLRYLKIDDMVADLLELVGPTTGSGSSRRTIGIVPSKSQRRWWLVGAAVIVLATGAVVAWLLVGPWMRSVTEARQVNVRVLSVTDARPGPQSDNWAELVRRDYLRTHLEAKQDVIVSDRESGTGKPDVDLEGSIVPEQSAFVLSVRILEPGTRNWRYDDTARFTNREDLASASLRIAEKVFWFLQVDVLNSDLKAWMPAGAVYDSATAAFVKASAYLLAARPGGGDFLYEALRHRPDFVAPRVWLIPALVNRGTREGRAEAEYHYRILQPLKGKVSEFQRAMIGLAECYLKGNLQCREAALEEGLRFAPGNRIVLENLGTARYRLEDYDGALRAYEPVIESRMPYPPAYPEYAAVLIKKKQFERARAVLKQALAVEPVFPDTYVMLAAFALKDRDSTDAKTLEMNFLKGSISDRSKWGEAHDLLGRCLLDLEEPQLAARVLGDAIAATPAAPSPHAAIARAFCALGDTGSGVEEARKALALSNDDCTEAHALLGRLFSQSGDADSAVVHYGKYLQRDSVTVTALDIHRALARADQRRVSGAKTQLNK